MSDVKKAMMETQDGGKVRNFVILVRNFESFGEKCCHFGEKLTKFHLEIMSEDSR